MSLYLVVEELVPVEELRPGDRLILPLGQRVTVERVDRYDGGFVVRWWRLAEHGEPGHRGAKHHVDRVNDEWDGRYLGSTILVPPGRCWRVDRQP